MLPKDVTLTFQEAANILKISPATVKNWLKAGVLKSTVLSHVKETEKKIAAGRLHRLQKGANKHHNRKIHAHNELLANPENILALKPLIEKHRTKKKELLLAVYLRQLLDAELVSYRKNRFTMGAGLKRELAAWNLDYQAPSFLLVFSEVNSIQADFSDSLLSFIHQSLSRISAKQDLGAYYTPASAVKKALKCIKTAGRVCDPCCGSGNFLVEAYLQIKTEGWPSAESRIFGYDCDPMAVLIARANLTLASFGKMDVVKAVRQRDFLLQQPIEEFNYIVTNPPWGSYPEKNQTEKLRRKFGLSKTKDSFSFFLLSSLQTLKLDGSGSFILPVSFMNVAAHAEIRRHLFSECTVNSIEVLDEKFSGVMTAAVLISFTNRRPLPAHEVRIKSGSKCKVRNADLLNSKNCLVPLYNDNQSLKVLREIEAASNSTLKGQATWGLGLVTGNNEKYLFDNPGPGRAPVITGNRVFRFLQPQATSFCHSVITDFQQAAPASVYLTEKKLIYRFIAKELVVAIDTQKLFTLNSANVLIPKSERYSCEFLCGLFNSRLGQYYFAKKYSSIKVLRSHLESFPLPAFNRNLFAKVEDCVAGLQKRYDAGLAERLDQLILDAYGLSGDSQKAILSYKLNERFHA